MEEPNNRKKIYVKGYSDAGASLSRRALKGFIPNSSSPSEDINPNNTILRQRSRQLCMSSPVAASAINTSRTKVVGVGLTLKSTIDKDILGISDETAEKWQKKTEAEFKLWAGKRQNCDALALNNFRSLQQVAFKSQLMSGDSFVIFKREEPTPLNPYGLRLHVIEADRVSTPIEYSGGYASGCFTEGEVPAGKIGAGNRIYDGVEVDSTGKVVAYYICNGYKNQTKLDKLEWTRVEAFGSKTGLPNILHLMDSERPDQYRGVPFLSSVIEPLLQLRRYTESELMAAIVQSLFTAWVETATDTSELPFNEVGSGDVAGIPGENPTEENISHSNNEYEMAPGTVIHLAPGEQVKFGNPNIPTAGFETFVKTLCKLIGSGLEIPYDVLVKEFNSSYSASRAALLEAWDGFRMRRTWLIDDLCKPVYEVWLAEAVARGRIHAPGFFDDPLTREAWCGSNWIGPVQGQLDPLKEIKATEKEIALGLKTHTQAARERGTDFEENVSQLNHEKARLIGANFSNTSTNNSKKNEEETQDEK